MEIKKYIPEVTAIGLPEIAATIIVAKSAVDGNPQNFNQLIALCGFATFYVGVPAAIVINAIKNLYLRHKGANNPPQKQKVVV